MNSWESFCTLISFLCFLIVQNAESWRRLTSFLCNEQKLWYYLTLEGISFNEPQLALMLQQSVTYPHKDFTQTCSILSLHGYILRGITTMEVQSRGSYLSMCPHCIRFRPERSATTSGSLRIDIVDLERKALSCRAFPRAAVHFDLTAFTTLQLDTPCCEVSYRACSLTTARHTFHA